MFYIIESSQDQVFYTRNTLGTAFAPAPWIILGKYSVDTKSNYIPVCFALERTIKMFVAKVLPKP